MNNLETDSITFFLQDQLSQKNPFFAGDSAQDDSKSKLQKFCDKLDKVSLIFTRRISDLCNSFCIAILSVSLSRSNGQASEPDFWYVGEVEGYLGEVSRSKVKTTRSKIVFLWDVLIGCKIRCLKMSPKAVKEAMKEYHYTTVRPKTCTQTGCTQSVCSFISVYFYITSNLNTKMF